VSHDFDPAAVTDLDVRELLARGMQPLPLILEMADALEPGRVLHVRSPFEPVPLYTVMSDRGFTHRASKFADDDWSSWFWRDDQPPPRPTPPPRRDAPEGTTDLRWLAPPEPLLWILAWCGEHPEGSLRVMLPCYPAPLIALLGDDGWQVRLEAEREDGVVVVLQSEKASRREG
jgi:uncharacterized protein (DUF2249 family)